jgi:hypothetical protein
LAVNHRCRILILIHQGHRTCNERDHEKNDEDDWDKAFPTESSHLFSDHDPSKGKVYDIKSSHVIPSTGLPQEGMPV